MKILKALFFIFVVLLLCGCEKTYKVSFETNSNKSVIVDSINYKAGDDINLPLPIWEDYKFDGWYIDLELTTVFNANKDINKDIILYAKWIKKYEVTFITNGGNEIPNQRLESGCKINLDKEPTRDEYIFAGWYSDNELKVPFDINYTIQKNITLYAKWNKDEVTVSFSFEANGSSGIKDVKIPRFSILQKPNNPLKEGHIFVGWYLDIDYSKQFNFSDTISKDIMLYAKWKIDAYYTVNFDTNEGSNINSLSVYNGEKANKPTNPTKKGNSFIGWFVDSEFSSEYDFNQEVVSNITLFAKWDVKQFTYTFMDSDIEINKITQGYNTLFTVEDPVKEGFTFIGWYKDDRFKTPFTDTHIDVLDKTIYAKYEINKYLVDFYSDDQLLKSNYLSYNSVIDYVPEKEGFKFLEWYLDSDLEVAYEEINMPSKNLKLYAKWNSYKYNISYYDFYKYTDVAYGNNHFLGLLNTGRLIVLGSNEKGQLGINSQVNKVTPVDITNNFNLNTGESIIDVECGFDYSFAITSLGRVFTWGNNDFGQLGIASASIVLTPTDITPNLKLQIGEKVDAIFLGKNTSFVRTNIGRIFSFGYDGQSQLGNGIGGFGEIIYDITNNFTLDADDFIIDIKSSRHTLALSSKGKLFGFGLNSNNQISSSDTYSVHTPLDITSALNLSEGDKVTSIAVGHNHSIISTFNGSIYGFGYNYEGQIGTEITSYMKNPNKIDLILDVDEKVLKIFAVADSSYVLTNKNNIYAWGRNRLEVFGYYWATEKTTITNITNRFDIFASNIMDIKMSETGIISITDDGRIYSYYYGVTDYKESENYTDYPSLNYPINIKESFKLDQDDRIIKIDSDTEFSVALSKKGRIFTFGDNEDGQLGNNTINIYYYPNEITSMFELSNDDYIIDLSVGNGYTIVCTNNGRVFGFGYNAANGINGDGYRTHIKPLEITNMFDFEENDKIIKLSSGKSHNLGLTIKNYVYAWGDNFELQVGPDSPGVIRFKFIKKELSYYSGTDMTYVKPPAIDVAAGGEHSIGVTDDGRTWTWGYNDIGQLGQGDMGYSELSDHIEDDISLEVGEKIIKVTAGSKNSYCLTNFGRLFVMGANNFGQLGILNISNSNSPILNDNFNLIGSERIINISSGDNHNFAYTSKGRIFVWGNNSYGQLGIGEEIITTPKVLEINNIGNYLNIFTGDDNSFIIDEQGNVFAFGYNRYGVLGTGKSGYLENVERNLVHIENVNYDTTLPEHSLVKEGYTFAGWFIDSNCSIEFNFEEKPNKDINLYAKWIKN